MGKLQRRLDLTELTFFGIGAIIGTGIFVIPAISTKIAGVASIWVWLQLGVLSIFMALSLAELSSIYPNAGGPYIFVKEAFGQFAGFLTGWIAWLISWITMASLAVAASFYLQYFVPLTNIQSILIAIALLGVMTLMNFHGLHWGVRAQFILTSVSILVLWFFITWGVYHIDIRNFIRPATVSVPSIFLAAVFIIEPFIGWETLTYFAEEAKNPQRDIPRAIVYSSVFVTIIYVATIVVTLGLLDTVALQGTVYPIAMAAGVFLGPGGASIVAIGAIAVLLGCLNSWVISTARLPYAIARDGLFPKFLNVIHKDHGTPHMALLLQFAFASVAIFFGTFEEIIYVLVTLAMFMYLLMFFSIPIHRMQHKKIPYKLPLRGLVPMISSLIAIGVLLLIEPIYILVSVGLIAIGAIAYRFMPIQQQSKS